MHINRNYPKILKNLEKSNSVIIFGPRGSGKSYFIKRLLKNFKNSFVVDLLQEKEFHRYAAKTSLIISEVESALQKKNISSTEPLYVFVDEVQRLPGILNDVHYLIEKHKPGCCFILTGSSARKLKTSDANLLAGRAIRYDFYPFSLDELKDNRFDSLSIQEILQFGTLPEVINHTDDEDFKKDYLLTYVANYLQEEIQRESEVRNLEGFSRFLELAALENSNSVNFAKIARAAQISSDSVKNYYQILVDTLIALEIPAWTYSVRKKMQKSSKYYIFDTGVINALSGDINSNIKPRTFLYGNLFESFVVNQIAREISLASAGVKLFNYRTLSGAEIDLVLQKNIKSDPVFLEIKSSESPAIEELRALKDVSKEYPDSKRFCISQTKNSFKEQGIEFLNFEEGIKEVIKAAL